MLKIHFALLAAGKSLRYGIEDKLLEEIEGKPLLSIMVNKISGIKKEWKGCTVLVTSEDKSCLYRDYGICIVNRYPEYGISHSISLALECIQNCPEWSKGDAVCFCVCDQPFLKKSTLTSMLEGYCKSGKGIGCIWNNGPKNPCVFREEYFAEMKKLSGDQGGKKILKEHLDDVYWYSARKEEVWDMDEKRMVVVRGGGDLATGTAYLLSKKGYRVLVLETDRPACIRRQVAFCEAVYEGTCQVEDMKARKIENANEAEDIWKAGDIPVLVDPDCRCLHYFHPLALVDGILAKKNLGTTIEMAPLTIGLGPGFTAGVDTDFVVETMRGETLGKIYRSGCALPNTGIPGMIAGYDKERVIHAPCEGEIHYLRKVGDLVEKGEPLALIGSKYVYATIRGYLRGAIKEGYPVVRGLKIMDIDPRTDSRERCFLISDKALTIGGSVCRILEEWERTCLKN